MIKKLLLLFIFFLQVGTLASAAADDEVLYQEISTTELADFSVDIPTNLEPGFRSITVLVTDETGFEREKVLTFCKNLEGEIHWNNICPDLTPVADQKTLEVIKLRSDLPKYDPISEPKKTVSTIVVAFAALSVLSAGAATSLKTPSPSQGGNSGGSQGQGSGYLSQLSAGVLIALNSDQDSPDGIGKSTATRFQRARNLPAVIGQKVSGFSPIMGRIATSGNYLRAIFADAAYLLFPSAIVLGFLASKSIGYQAIPPSLIFMLALIGLGTFDAFAGLLAALSFATPVLLTGGVDSLHAGMTLAGVALLAFAPALIAGAFRPMRRRVNNFASFWERGSDYLLAAVLTSWILRQMVQGLPGLAGVQLPITASANRIAIFGGAMIVIRLLGEDIALRHFSKRHGYAEAPARNQRTFQLILSDLVKIAVFVLVAEPFVGRSIELWIGTAIFALPFLLDIFDLHFPKSRWIFRFIPTGTVEIIFMATLGAVFALVIQGYIANPRTFVLISFVLLSIPGLILRFISSFGDESHEEWRETKLGAFFFRVTGILVFALLVEMFIRGSLVS